MYNCKRSNRWPFLVTTKDWSLHLIRGPDYGAGAPSVLRELLLA